MATRKQIEANRRNAQKSTGPTTAEGREIVSRNAITHGLTAARMIVLPEEQDAFAQLERRLREEWGPEGPRENLWVDRIAHCWLRLQRMGNLETSILLAECCSVREEDAAAGAVSGQLPPPEALPGRAYARASAQFARLARHERQLERSHAEAVRELELLQYSRHLQCSPFYARNLRRFPSPSQARNEKDEGRFRRRPEREPDFSDIMLPPE